MQLEGSCHCGAVTFTVRSSQPYPFMRCYCSICRKTAGSGGYAINLGADASSMKVLRGKRHLRVYRAILRDDTKDAGAPQEAGATRQTPEAGAGSAPPPRTSTAQRHFCARCGSPLWLFDPTWPELVHPHASAIDTPLPTPPDHVHLMLGSKASWVTVEGAPGDARFDAYPDLSLAEWHDRRGLTHTD